MNDYAEFLKPSDCTLLLVDFQKTLLDFCVDPEGVARNAAALIEAVRIFDIPVLFTVQNPGKLGGILPELLERAPGAPVFDKLEFSSFENMAIAAAFRDTRRRTILIAGMETHVCIFHTGADALNLGYRLHVAADAVTSRIELNREIGLRRLEMAGAVISSTEMMIFELLNRSGTAEFRAALPLLKNLYSQKPR